MDVGLEREAGVCVAQPGLNLLHVPACLEKQAGAGVAERMKGHGRPRFSRAVDHHLNFEPGRDSRGSQGAAVDVFGAKGGARLRCEYGCVGLSICAAATAWAAWRLGRGPRLQAAIELEREAAKREIEQSEGEKEGLVSHHQNAQIAEKVMLRCSI